MRTVVEQERIFTGIVNGTGIPATGVGYTVTKAGVGNYIVRFQGAKYVKSVSAILNAGSGFVTLYTYPTLDSAQFLFYSNASAAIDVPFAFIAIVVMMR